MGIRFRCHHCEHELNLKEFQAGRRARCPACSGRFRVPTASADFSDPLDDQEVQLAAAAITGQQALSDRSGSGPTAGAAATFNLRPSNSDPDIVASRSATASVGGQSTAASTPVLPEAIREAPQAVWYVRPPGGEQYGPAEGYVFHGWLQDNRVSPDSLVWRDGWPEWQSAGDVFAEHFHADWRLAHDVANSGVSPNDDTIDSPIADVEDNPTVVSNVAALRRKKKQTTYGIVIGVLALLALVLIGVLVSVVFKASGP